MNNKTTHIVRLFILVTIMLVTILPTGSASAALAKCRTDPKFFLSNGETVTVVLDINTDEASVLYVNYFLHVPAGVTVKNVVFTAGGIGKLETYWVFQDSPANTYTTETLVITRQSGVAVVATASLSNKNIISVSGYSGQNLVSTLSTSGTASTATSTARQK